MLTCLIRSVRLVTVLVLFAALARADEPADPLASWNESPAKAGIVAFVRAATDPSSPGFVPTAERIATFDNDGTMWVEQPLYTQVVFAVDRVKLLAPDHPEWRTEQPFEALLTAGPAALARFSIDDFGRILAATHAGITTDEMHAFAGGWLATARHPRFNRLYTQLVYQPMLELMQYLRAQGFKTYIVTGGGQEFVRVFAEGVYGVPPEQVLGSASRAKYEYAADGRPVLRRSPKIMLVDDQGGKPEGINFMIGRRPVAAFGNSTGDREMLEWTQAGTAANDGRARLMMLVHHDDAKREYAYGADSKVGTFSDELMAEAKKRGWFVISMRNDWKQIFSFDE